MVLETVLLRGVEVAALILCHSDAPFPGGRGGGGVDVQGDGDTGVTGWDPHVLPSVVATDCWGGIITGNTHCESVSVTLPNIDTVRESRLGGKWGSEDHCIKVNPQFADVHVVLAVGIDAGVRVSGGGITVDDGVRGVLGGTPSTGQGEDAADSEAGSTGSRA